METLSKESLIKLNEVQSEHYISIYIPTHRAGEAVNNGQDIITFKNHIQKVKNELQSKGMHEKNIKELLTEAYKLIDDTGFWRQQSDGLAVFIGDNFFSYYRLPYSFAASCTVAKAFDLKNLMPLLHGDGLYYVLALSNNEIKLYEASRNSIKKVALPEDMPKSFDEATTELEVEASLQFRSKQTTAGEGTMYHGQGRGKDDQEGFVLEEYLRQVAKPIFDLVKEKEAPMILYGTEKIKSLYHQANLYNGLLKESLDGNPEEVKIQEVHKKSWDLVRNSFRKGRDEYMKRYSELSGTGRTSYDLGKIVPAAENGRVEALFVAKNSQVWGAFDKDNQTVEVHKDRQETDEDLVNKATLKTFLNSGKVYLMDKEDLPEYTVDTPMVAVMRF